MHKKSLLVLAIGTLAAGSFIGGANAQPAAPNFSGTYRCDPQPVSCQAAGQTFTVTQTGNDLEIKNDKGLVGRAKATSNISLSAGGPWNMLGVVAPDGRIEWSNGTVWSKSKQ